MSRKSIIILIVFFAVAIILTIGYNVVLDKNLAEFATQILEEVSTQQQIIISSKLQSDKDTLRVYAKIITNANLSHDETLELLNSVIEDSDFIHLFIVDTKGQGVIQTGETIDISDREHFQEAMDGRTVIGLPVLSKVKDTKLLPIATPIIDEKDSITGVLIGSYDLSIFQDLVLSSFGGKEIGFVLSPDDGILFATMNINASSNSYQKALAAFPSEKGPILNLITQHPTEGNVKFNLHNSNYYVHYSDIGINDWTLLTAIDEKFISDYIDQMRLSSWVIATIICISLIVLGILLYRQSKIFAKELAHRASYDKKTGLPNLETFKQEIAQIIKAHPSKIFSCYIFDICNFKVINDMFGFQNGDYVLMGFASILKQIMKAVPSGQSCASRLYSDTYAVFFPVDSIPMIRQTMENAKQEFYQSATFLNGYPIDFYISKINTHIEHDADQLLEKAIMAHTKTLMFPPNTIVDYEDLYKEELLKEAAVRNNMEKAFQEQEFKVFLQPKIDLATGKACSAEALVRWSHDGQYILPGTFLPVLEKNGMIIKLDLFMFDRCCQLLSQYEFCKIPIAVNFSRQHLVIHGFAQQLKDIADKYELSPSYFIIEITENTAIENTERLKIVTKELQDFGFKISMDDFGSGYSSLGILNQLMVDEVKLDRSLIHDITANARTYCIVRNIIRLVKELGISIVAEGIETQEQWDILRNLGCEVAQGFYFARPAPADTVFIQHQQHNYITASKHEGNQ